MVYRKKMFMILCQAYVVLLAPFIFYAWIVFYKKKKGKQEKWSMYPISANILFLSFFIAGNILFVADISGSDRNRSSHLTQPKPDTLNSTQDTLFLQRKLDTLQTKTQNDLLINLTEKDLIIKDSLPYHKPGDTLKVRLQNDQDSLMFYTKMIKSLLENNLSSHPEDSVYKALNYLIHYMEQGPIDKTISFLSKKINQIGPITESAKNDSIDQITPDSLYTLSALPPYTIAGHTGNHFLREDTIVQAISFLLSKVAYDSVPFRILNLYNEGLDLSLMKSKQTYQRFWLKNELNDSLGLWVKPVNHHSIRLLLEEGLYLRRISKPKRQETQPFEAEMDGTLKQMHIHRLEKPAWTFSGLGDINLSQGELKNWAKGGESSISMLNVLNINAVYDKNKARWENDFQMKLGFLRSGNENDIRKNEDVFELVSKYGTKAFNSWYYSLEGSFKSQFGRGYDYSGDTRTRVSDFMAPAYLVFALGLDYKPSKKISVLISPITSKYTFVTDTVNIDHTKYGINKEKKTKADLGAYLKANIKYDLTEDIGFESKFSWFTNYVGKDKIVVDWETNMIFKVNQWITTKLLIHMIYDDNVLFPIKDEAGNTIDEVKRLQFKEILGIGFRYKF